MGVALSTSWNAYRFDHGAKLLFEIKQLGFNSVELSFNLTLRMVKQLSRQAEKSGVKIVSAHNFCPVPDRIPRELALPDYYSLASTDEHNRSLAIKFTKRSIDTVSVLGAKVLVLHCGRVEIGDHTRRLIELYQEGRLRSSEFKEVKKKMIAERSRVEKKFLTQALRSLDALNAYAKLKRVFLGVENRFYYREIPQIDEIGLILDKFRGSQIYYWHDTGHAQIMEHLGFAKHRDFLTRYSKRLIGTHLHDVLGCQDHLAPLQGKIDFVSLKPYLKRDSLKVIEAHRLATPAELIASRNFIAQLYGQ